MNNPVMRPIHTNGRNFEILHDHAKCGNLSPSMCTFVDTFETNPFSSKTPCIVEVVVHKLFLDKINGQTLESYASSGLLDQKKIESLNGRGETIWKNCELCLTDAKSCNSANNAIKGIFYTSKNGEKLYLAESRKHKFTIAYEKPPHKLSLLHTEWLAHSLNEENMPLHDQSEFVEKIKVHNCNHRLRVPQLPMQWDRIEVCTACREGEPCEFKEICLFEL